MRKTFALSMSLVTFLLTNTVVSASDYVTGDVDMDGKITAHDAAVISRYSQEKDISLSAEQILLADYNGDSLVDENDAVAVNNVVEYALGDIDKNGIIEITDFLYVLNLCAPYKDVDSKDDLAVCDVDADGIITINDFSLLEAYYYYSGTGSMVDFGCSYFHWNVEEMLLPERVVVSGSNVMITPLNFYGDVNYDGCINELDAEFIKDYIEGVRIEEGIVIAEGDINIDGVIDQNDIDMIIENATYLVADVNSDCYVNIDDAVEVLSYYAQKGSSNTAFEQLLMSNTNEYDVNLDGNVDVSDAVEVLAESAMIGAAANS